MTGPSNSYPNYPSHYRPRTPAGRWAVGLFVGLFAFTQPPLVFWLANRIEPRLLGAPLLYWYLLIVYGALISVLIWARRRNV